VHRLIHISFLFFLAATTAQAGPWPREKGTGFSAVTASYRYAPETNTYDSEGGFYLEGGWKDRVTIGFNALDTLEDYRHAYGFVRWAATAPENRMKLAFTLGAGASNRNGEWGPMTRIAVSAGRGFDTFRSGWWSVTAAVEDHNLWTETLYKLDMTIGLNLTKNLKSILDVEASRRRGSADSLTVRGYLAFPLNAKSHFLIGLEAKDAGQRRYGIRAGLWHRF